MGTLQLVVTIIGIALCVMIIFGLVLSAIIFVKVIKHIFGGMKKHGLK